MKRCTICQLESEEIFTHKVLFTYDVKYFHCAHCHFIFTEDPYWLEEAYSDSITNTDVGYVERNNFMSRITFILLIFLFGRKYEYLDYAGGYGLFTRLMNDMGFKFYWSDSYTKNIFARGLEYGNEKVKVVTCFEAFEHFVDPIAEINKLTKISPNILFSTKLIPADSIPDQKTWGYYGFDHGQHISFYSEKTLYVLAEKWNLNIVSDKQNVHLFTKNRINSYLFRGILLLRKIHLDILLRKMI